MGQISELSYKELYEKYQANKNVIWIVLELSLARLLQNIL